MTISRLLIVYIMVLSTYSFGGDKRISNIPASKIFSNLNFTVSVDYSSSALKKLRKSNEKVKVWVIIDQYGKQYMEDEGVADGEIVINPGEKAVFHGVPLSDSHYRYKSNKKYLLTIMVISARKIYENNILLCHSKSNKDYTIHTIQDEVVEFACKLLEDVY